jgi:hypothetical protein
VAVRTALLCLFLEVSKIVSEQKNQYFAKTMLDLNFMRYEKYFYD